MNFHQKRVNCMLLISVFAATIFSVTESYPQRGYDRPTLHPSDENSYRNRDNNCRIGHCVRAKDCPEYCSVLRISEPCVYGVDDVWVCCVYPSEEGFELRETDVIYTTVSPKKFSTVPKAEHDNAWNEHDFDKKQYDYDSDYVDNGYVKEDYYQYSWRKTTKRSTTKPSNSSGNSWKKQSTTNPFTKRTLSTLGKSTTVEGWNNKWHQQSTTGYPKKTTVDPWGKPTTTLFVKKKTTKPPNYPTTFSWSMKTTKNWRKNTTINSLNKKTTEAAYINSTRNHLSNEASKPATSFTTKKTLNAWNKHPTSNPPNNRTTIPPKILPTRKNWHSWNNTPVTTTWSTSTKNDWWDNKATPSYGKSTRFTAKPTISTKATRTLPSPRPTSKTNRPFVTIRPTSKTNAWFWPESEEIKEYEWKSTTKINPVTKRSFIRTTASARNDVNSKTQSSTKRRRITTSMPNVNTHICGISIVNNRNGRRRNDGNNNPDSRGNRSRQPFQRIVGGKEVEPFSWPWVAALYKVTVTSGGNRFLSAGSLINAQYVLTAAHVFTPDDLRSSSYVVLLGTHNVTESLAEYLVSSVLQHPQYEQRYYYNDIALLKLSQPVQFNDFVMPVCLPSPQAPLLEDSDLVGKRVTVMGWGDDSFGGKSSIVLREATLSIVSRTSCNASYIQVASNRFPRGITEEMLCAGSPNGGKDACQGDSGGPLTSIENGRYTQVGIVSFGYKCGDREYPGVYTKVAHYLGWIAENTQRREYDYDYHGR